MIISDDWDELVEWLDKRFPNRSWRPEQAIAYYADMRERFDMSDVWTSVFAMYEKGQTFAPNGSQLIADTIRVVRHAAVDELYRGLPETAGERPPVEGWIKKRFGVNMTGTELIARIHKERGPCKTKTCDVCYRVKVGADNER
ncbi:hypothetical protein LCGC14_1435560 [marine sediment metagenome]|uniref:Uncharacterized protein n=1 Tax=marine sediment metagenome TaxID=412755 RepID=A0A0F9MP68_9ZZZZ